MTNTFLNVDENFFLVPSAGVDPPSARGLPFPPVVTASALATNAIFTDSTASTIKGRSAVVIFILHFFSPHSSLKRF